MEDSFSQEDLLASDDLQHELLKLDTTNLVQQPNINNNNKRSAPPLFQSISDGEDDDDDDEEEDEEELGVPKAYTGKEDYAQEKYYQSTGFGQGGLFMRNKRKKLEVQHAALLEDEEELVTRPQIFKGLYLYINGLTDEMGLRQLTELIVRHGGTHVVFLDRKKSVTHIIAEILTPKKFEEFKSYSVARPSWLLDSVKAGRLLDWNKYSTVRNYMKPSDGTKLGVNDTERMGTQVAQMRLQFGVMQAGKESNQGGMEVSGGGSGFSGNEGASTSILPTTPKKSSPSTNLSPVKIISPMKLTSPSTKLQDDMPTSFFPTILNKAFSDACFSDPEWLKQNTAQNPDWLRTYFAESRLSHLSIWKQELITLVGEIQEEEPRLSQKQQGKRKKGLTGGESDGRTIMHVDFDCFFVSAGLTSREHLRGKAVAVCHSEGKTAGSTSEIASCSYEAREKGVLNGMSFGKASELCPEIVSIPFEFDLYKTISRKFYKILLSHSNFLQAVSVDECLIEVTIPPTLSNSPDPALELAHQIRAEIKAATACEASIGISHNILLAKLATRKAKPASAYHLRDSDVTEFMANLDVEALPGIGRSKGGDLRAKLGVETIQQLRNVSGIRLQEAVGGTGKKLFSYARGIDTKELEGKRERQSLEVTANYAIRLSEGAQVKTFLKILSAELSARLKKQKFLALNLTLNVKKRHPEAPIVTPKYLGHGVCTVHSKKEAMAGPGGAPTDDADVIFKLAWTLLQRLHIEPEELRGFAMGSDELRRAGAKGPENGQGLLGFGKIEKGTKDDRGIDSSSVARSSKSILKDKPLAQAKAKSNLNKEPSIIIIDTDSDGSSSSSPLPPPPKKSPKKLKGKKEKIPAMFRPQIATRAPSFPTASQISDSDLKFLDIDVEVFRSFPENIQQEILKDKRTSSAGLRLQPSLSGGQSMLFGKASKPGASNDTKDHKKNLVEPILPAPTSSPIDITDEAIIKLGYNVSTFRELTLEDQRSILKEARQFQKKFTILADRPAEKTRIQSRHINLVDFKPALPPRFHGKTDLEEIREGVEGWFDTCKEEGPGAEDLEKFVQYLEKCVDPRRVGAGRDLGKAKSLLKWWEYLIEAEYGSSDKCESRVGKIWWEETKRAQGRVQFFVEKEFGAGASLFVNSP